MSIALRQKKFYKTRLTLAEFFIENLRSVNFDSISIKDICIKAEISEATFFNYFPQKIDVITYWLKTKLFKLYWFIEKFQKDTSFTKVIEKTFELLSSEIKHPFIFHEVIALFKTNKKQVSLMEISQEELQFIHPDCQDLHLTKFYTINEFFEKLIEGGINANDIPKNICKKTLEQFLMTILLGVPLSTPISEYSNIDKIYQKHLSLLWKIFQL